MDRGFRLKDKNKPDGPKVRLPVNAGINETDLAHKKYTLPFNQKNFDMLYKQRPWQSPSSVSLVIMDEGSSEAPRQIDSADKFSKTPFEDLWIEATTPKFKLDRSYKDNLEARHITWLWLNRIFPIIYWGQVACNDIPLRRVTLDSPASDTKPISYVEFPAVSFV